MTNHADKRIDRANEIIVELRRIAYMALITASGWGEL